MGKIYEALGYSPGEELSYCLKETKVLMGNETINSIPQICNSLIQTTGDVLYIYYKLLKGCLTPISNMENSRKKIYDLLVELNMSILLGYIGIFKVMNILKITDIFIGSYLERLLTKKNLHEAILFKTAHFKTILSYASYLINEHYQLPRDKIQAVNTRKIIAGMDDSKTFMAGSYAGVHILAHSKIMGFDTLIQISKLNNIVMAMDSDSSGTIAMNIVMDTLLSYSVIANYLDFSEDSLIPLFIAYNDED